MCVRLSEAVGAATRRMLLDDREGVVNERERERGSATREAGLRQRTMLRALRRAVGAATRRVLRASTMSPVCARGGGASAAEGLQRASAVPRRRKGSGSDAEGPVLRWRRLAWPEASTADREVGGHTSREVDPKPMRGLRRESGCKRCTSRVQAVHWQVPESTVSASMEHKTKSVCE